MTLRLTPRYDRVLMKLAELEGVSKHEAALRSIEESYARRVQTDEVSELTKRAKERYGALLGRFAR